MPGQCDENLSVMDTTANFAIFVPREMNSSWFQYICPCSPVERFRVGDDAIVIKDQRVNAVFLDQLEIP